MTKYFLVLLLISSNVMAQAWKPDPYEVEQNGETNIRVMKRYRPFTLLAETTQATRYDQEQYSHYRFGFYQRISRAWKYGVFYQHSIGLRHNDDWIKKDVGWGWKDKETEADGLMMLDLTFKRKVSWISKQLLFSLKNRYVVNLNNEERVVRVRPGIIWLIMGQSRPLFDVFLQYEYYHPLNFSESSPYERWYYFGFLFHLNNNIHFGPQFSISYHNWTNSQDLKDLQPDKDYTTIIESQNVGLNFIYTF
jgi:hypothetical protein